MELAAMPKLSQGLVAGSNGAGAQVLHLGSFTWEQLLYGLSDAQTGVRIRLLKGMYVMGHQMGP